MVCSFGDQNDVAVKMAQVTKRLVELISAALDTNRLLLQELMLSPDWEEFKK